MEGEEGRGGEKREGRGKEGGNEGGGREWLGSALIRYCDTSYFDASPYCCIRYTQVYGVRVVFLEHGGEGGLGIFKSPVCTTCKSATNRGPCTIHIMCPFLPARTSAAGANAAQRASASYTLVYIKQNIGTFRTGQPATDSCNMTL